MSLIQEKVAQAAALLRELDLPCWLTFVRETGILPDPVMPFLAPGHVTWHSAFLVPATGRAVAIVGQYDRKAIEETGAYERVEGYVQGYKPALLAALRGLDPNAIAVNYSEDSEVCDGLTHGMFLTLRRVLAEIGYADRLVSAERLVAALRARKTPQELARIRAAVLETERIFDEVGRFLAPGRTERDVADLVARLRAERGLETAWEAATCPAVFTGPDTAGAHYGPTSRAIARGHIVNMDFGVKSEDYCADLQRTFYVRREGETSVPEPVARGFSTIAQAIESARRALRPGVAGRDVDRVAREVVTSAGYEEFPHALGHQVGRFAHDGAALLGPTWEKYGGRPLVPVEEGMVFTLEPRLTVQGYGVATVEEMVVVTRDGAEFLSDPQTTLRVVG
ncbi:MAG: Xaa-Pro aminopeptidase [Acidobacteria bacterium]|nr:Xaa-Pro aminopeptidase [Acidobacteriota bacterium]